MTHILSALGCSDEILASVAKALPTDVRDLDMRGDVASVSDVRAFVAQADPAMTHFTLVIGTGLAGAITPADWQGGVMHPLQLAFGLVTGAALRFRALGAGAITIVVPSSGLLPIDLPTTGSVLFRAIVGMGEALRAELAAVKDVRVGIVFYDPDEIETDIFSDRVRDGVERGAMYGLSPRLTRERIETYFATMLAEVDLASAGPPLPDIGPMAAVYDRAAIGAPAGR